MKNKVMKSTLLAVRARLSAGAALCLLLAVGPARAGSVDHYIPGVFNIRDFFLPAEPGVYGGVYNYFYHSEQFNDANGNAVNSISVPPGPGGVTVNVNPDINLYALIPVVIWEPCLDLCGIKYAAWIAPSFANSSLDAEISTLRGNGVNVGTSTFGVGDLYVEPAWLGYGLTNFDFSLAYGFYAPVGRYSTTTVGPITIPSPDNIGLGFWTQQFQGAVAVYPWADKRMAIMAAVTYQLNSEKRDIDVTPGQHLTLNWGISQYLPLKKDKTLLLEIGPAGYDDWQITDDTGSGAIDPSTRDQVHAVGGQIGITCVPLNAALNFHAYKEYSAIDRMQGAAYNISFLIKF
jgi:hypothetical protein